MKTDASTETKGLVEAAQHNMGSVTKPHYVVDVDLALKIETVLRALTKALGDTPVGMLDQATTRAYAAAMNLLEPDEFTERFMAQATHE